MTSTLTLRNDGAKAAPVRVGFMSLEGDDVGNRVISVARHSESRIDLDSVQMPTHRFEELGSIEITTDSEDISGRVTIEFRSSATTAALDEKLQIAAVQQELASAKIPPELISVPVLAVHNWSISTQRVSIDCSDVEGRDYESQMILPPKVTFLVNACIRGQADARSYKQLLSGDHGKSLKPTKIKVRAEGNPHGIAVWGFGAAAKGGSSIPRVVGIEFAPWGPPL